MAHDIYSRFMDMYDHGATIDVLKQAYENGKQESYDDWEYEIYVTVHALAFWETGQITTDLLKEVEEVIEKKASVNNWIMECGEKYGKAREKELDKFWLKINHPKEKPRKSKQYKQRDLFLFQAGDVLAFQGPDKTYHITAIMDISQEKGKCYYTFCRTEPELLQMPTINDMENITFIGNRSGINLSPYLWGIELEHNKLKKSLSNFCIIGNIRLNNTGRSYYPALNYKDFCTKFPLNKEEEKQAGFIGMTIHRFNIKELILQK